MSADGNGEEQVAAQLLRHELALLDPSVRRHRDRVSALLAEDFIEFGSSGRVWTREIIIDLLANEEFQPTALEDFHCGRIADGVMLVTYRTVRPGVDGGAPTSTLRSSLWVREASGEWRIRFHQGTPAA
jgi:hypothetical protein